MEGRTSISNLHQYLFPVAGGAWILELTPARCVRLPLTASHNLPRCIVCGAPMHPQTQGNIKSWHQTLKKPRTTERIVRRTLQPPALSREPEQRHTCLCLLRQITCNHQTTREDQTKNHRTKALASPQACRIISNQQMNPSTHLF